MVLSSEFEDAAAAPSERLLFQPFQIGTRRLKNRIFMSACGTEFGEDGHPSEQQIRYYERRALGGVGLIHIEFCSIDVSSVMNDRVLRIDEDRFIPGMKILVDRLHSLDVMVVLQLAHAGRQMRAGVAPSAIPCPVIKGTPRALETAEVEHLIEQFAQGARRAKDAGFDGIQVHGAHGYLVHEFVSPLSNQRSDRFGGAWENRRRFPLEVVRRIRALTRSDFLIGYKISAEDNLEGGITLAKTTELAQELEEAGIDYLEVSTGTYASLEHAVQPAMFRRGYLVHYATHMKQELQIPVVAVGRINDPDVAEEILQTGGADIVAFGRGLIADPDLPIKAREGRFDDIRRCVACNQCLASIFRSESMACLINP